MAIKPRKLPPGWFPPQALPDDGYATQATINESNAMGNSAPQLEMPSAVRGPNLVKKNSIVEDQKASNKFTNEALRNYYAPKEDFDRLVSDAKDTIGYDQQVQDDKALNDYLAQTILSQKPQMDLSPLAALTDAWSGSNFAKTYKAPKGIDPDAVVKYAKERTQAGKVLQDEILKAIQARKFGSDKTGMTNGGEFTLKIANEASDPQPRGQTGQIANQEKYVVDKSKEIGKEFSTSKSQLDALDTALARGDVNGISVSLGQGARILSGEKGVLTDRDVGRVLPQTIGMTIAQFESWLTNNPKVLLDPKITQGLKELMGEAKARLKQQYQERINSFEGQLGGTQTYSKLNVPGILKPIKDSINSLEVPERRIPILAPDGKRGSVPESKYQELIQSNKGYKPVTK